MSDPPGRDVAWIAQYEALVGHAGVIELGHRTQIELTGHDRAAFLHNLTTNEIRKLPPGSGCETFLTSVQGKTLAHAFVFVQDQALVIDTVPGQADVILKHLDHYLVSEQVTLTDRTGEWSELLVAGPDAECVLTELSGSTPQNRLQHNTTTMAGRTVSIRRTDMAGPVGFLISGHADEMAAVRKALVAARVVECDEQAFEAARIEWGFPWFGIDISDKNLPQEVARDALAISFIKGCYLGQETVARIDALGHVNRTLVGVRCQSEAVPPVGMELFASGAKVGEVTSATWSPRFSAPLALAYVRRGLNVPGTRLTSLLEEAEVVRLRGSGGEDQQTMTDR